LSLAVPRSIVRSGFTHSSVCNLGHDIYPRKSWMWRCIVPWIW